MKLAEELKLKKPLASINHEALLSLVRTASMVQKGSDRFFSRFGVTDVQFNILMILKDSEGGLSQQELSEHLIVSKSNVVGLIDRLENGNYLQRSSHPTDRRFYRIVLTAKGKELVAKVEKSYFKEVDNMMNALSDSQKRALILATEKIRQYIREKAQSQEAL